MGAFMSALSAISQGTPEANRINEDAYYFSGTPDGLYLVVIDGASVRVNTATLERAITAPSGDATAASYAARLTRDTIASVLASSMTNSALPTPSSLLLAANAELRARVETIFGGLSSDAVLAVEPQLDILREDPRLIRLLLPVCVASVVHVDLAASALHYAHAGDTALLVQHADGSVVHVTGDNMEAHDRTALRPAKRKQQSDTRLHIADLLSDEEVLSLNRENGLYHNYVDELGKPDLTVGVGVIDGLPELGEYIQQGTLNLSDIRGLLACSDGFLWPAVWDESETEQSARLQQMWEMIAHDGLGGYVRRLRALEIQDRQLDMYPRFKLHDDATAIHVELQHE